MPAYLRIIVYKGLSYGNVNRKVGKRVSAEVKKQKTATIILRMNTLK